LPLARDCALAADNEQNRTGFLVMKAKVGLPIFVVVLSMSAVSVHADGYDSSEETRELREQIEQVQRQLARMQQQLAELEAERDEVRREQDEAERRLAEFEEMEERVARVEEAAAEDEEGIDFGGAMRLNYAWRDYDEQNKDRFGDFELELFRVNVSGSVGDVLLDAEWRRYNDFQAIHHAWVGYNFSDELQMRLGISRVPFGILPYPSHSFWFTGNYYLGYEDDYDTGIQFIHKPSEDWTFQYGFFKNPEYANDSRSDRYSFDLVTGGDQHNTETNQINFRAERHLRFSEAANMNLGLSAQAGQIYNRATEEDGERWAIMGHMDSYFGPYNLRLQAMRYEYNPENPAGVSDDFVQKGAFGFPFLMAAQANVYTYSFSRSFDVGWGPISWVNCYNEGTLIDADVSNSDESIQSPRLNLTRFHGVFAPNSRYRARITPARRGRGAKPTKQTQTEDRTPAEQRSAMRWAKRRGPA
jgi:hypothetical protein